MINRRNLARIEVKPSSRIDDGSKRAIIPTNNRRKLVNRTSPRRNDVVIIIESGRDGIAWDSDALVSSLYSGGIPQRKIMGTTTSPVGVIRHRNIARSIPRRREDRRFKISILY